MNRHHEFEGLGSEQTDQKQNYPGGGADAESIVSALPDKSVHFCRGCGGELACDSRSYFHPECLKADKRRRIRERRAREREQFARWLRQVNCPQCGHRYGERPSDQSETCPREASQGPQKGREATGWP
jgi:hypothetical protein